MAEAARIINKIPLSVTEIIIEDVQVDIARLNNPELRGEDYQQAGLMKI